MYSIMRARCNGNQLGARPHHSPLQKKAFLGTPTKVSNHGKKRGPGSLAEATNLPRAKKQKIASARDPAAIGATT